MLRLLFDPVFLKHDTGVAHPERPERLVAIMRIAAGIDNIQICKSCRAATDGELCRVHSRDYIDEVSSINSPSLVMLDPDTVLSPHSLEAARKAAGAVIEAVEYVFSASDNRAFCAVRPPGHHAEPDKAMGFCIFNNLAVGAAHALNSGLAKRIAIIDWDVHHGNGTQKMFYGDPRALAISLHQYPFYPGTGGSSETGDGAGVGFTINLPMRPGSGDVEYRQVFGEIILPAVDNFAPELILISAGFDAHINDPLAQINLSTEYFGEMTKLILDRAIKYCQGRIVSVLEGGYDLNVLAKCVTIHLEVLKGGN